MEYIELILSILASVAAIVSVVLSVGNTIRINRLEDHSKNITSGNGSTNTIGNRNKIG